MRSARRSNSLALLAMAAICAALGMLQVARGETAPAVTVAVAAAQADPTVLGTVEATVDGEAHTWYVVSGMSGGRQYASGGWSEMSPGERMITIGAFDTPTPPLESFEWSPERMPSSFGDYHGSAINLLVRLRDGATTLQLSFPPDHSSAVVYMPTATLDISEPVYAIAAGELAVTSATVDAETASIEGTFSGTLERMMGEGAVTVTDGRFAVKGLKSLVQ